MVVYAVNSRMKKNCFTLRLFHYVNQPQPKRICKRKEHMYECRARGIQGWLVARHSAEIALVA